MYKEISIDFHKCEIRYRNSKQFKKGEWLIESQRDYRDERITMDEMLVISRLSIMEMERMLEPYDTFSQMLEILTGKSE